ncbi:MAG TPA: hypothetical protein VLV48_00690 [Thermoanaerobaculia bacterium]|nr:hypothetical protein [Thermoanaerobaculia bacterium]
MKRPLFLLVLLAAACGAPEEPARVTITKRGDLTVSSRELPADGTLAAVGLAPAGDKREGSSEWDGSFQDGERRTERDGVRREFRVTLSNRSATAREFHARLDYIAPDGTLLRRRTLTNLVMPPFTETVWSGSVLLPPPGNADVDARILPATEPFEGSEDR